MRVMVGLVIVPKPPQRLDYGALRLRLARVNHVINFSDVAKVRMLLLPLLRRNPALMAIWIQIKLLISEIFSQQPKLPHVIRVVFANITDGAIGTHDNLLIFLSDLLCAPCALRG